MKKVDLEGLEEDGDNPVVLFEVPAEYGPDWSYELSTLEIDQTDIMDEDGNAVLGICHYGKRRVLINAEVETWMQQVVILHEMLHTLFEFHGIGWLDGNKEEDLVTYLAPRLYKSLTAVGFKWPKRSKEANALCRKATLEAS